MTDNLIPFEVHITVSDLPMSALDRFIELCQMEEGKAILIELSRGECVQQPMFTKVWKADNFDIVQPLIAKTAEKFTANAFNVNRIKVEIPAFHSELLGDNANNYFEWHGKIIFNDEKTIAAICNKHQVHLSLNALKDNKTTRFITLRAFSSKELFLKRLELLLNDLSKHQIELIKQESEYCIFDSNKALDNGWLTL